MVVTVVKNTYFILHQDLKIDIFKDHVNYLSTDKTGVRFLVPLYEAQFIFEQIVLKDPVEHYVIICYKQTFEQIFHVRLLYFQLFFYAVEVRMAVYYKSNHRQQKVSTLL